MPAQVLLPFVSSEIHAIALLPRLAGHNCMHATFCSSCSCGPQRHIKSAGSSTHCWTRECPPAPHMLMDTGSELLHLAIHVNTQEVLSYAEESPAIRLGSSLVITAVGGGTAVIPFLTGKFTLLRLSGLTAQQAWLRTLALLRHLAKRNPLTVCHVLCSVCSVACILHILGDLPLHLNIASLTAIIS